MLSTVHFLFSTTSFARQRLPVRHGAIPILATLEVLGPHSGNSSSQPETSVALSNTFSIRIHVPYGI